MGIQCESGAVPAAVILYEKVLVFYNATVLFNEWEGKKLRLRKVRRPIKTKIINTKNFQEEKYSVFQIL